PEGEITEETLPQAWKAFHAAHEAEYGRAFESSPIEIVNVRVSGVGRVPKLRAMNTPKGGSLERARIRVSSCLFRVGGVLQSFETPFYRRSELPVERPLPAPPSSCKLTAPRSFRPAQVRGLTGPEISSSSSEDCNDCSFSGGC